MNGFEPQWIEYRRRRKLFAFVFIGYMPVVSAAAFIEGRIFHTQIFAFTLAFGWMAFFLMSGIRLNTWPCPRCGEWFFATWWYNNPFARRCVHCKLPKYSDSC